MTIYKTLNNKINYKAKNCCDKHSSNYLAIGVMGVSIFIISLIFPEIALASKFDIDAGVAAGTNPLVKAVNDHWGKAVALVASGGAIIGGGDGRERAINAAKYAVVAGAVILGLLAMLT